MSADSAPPVPLARVLQRLHRYLDRHGHRLTTSDGRLDDLYVSLAEARETLGGETGTLPIGPPPDTLSPLPPTLDALADAFDLDPVERELLLLAAAPALDLGVARLYTFAWADFTLKQPTAGFLAELVGDPTALAALRPDRPLARNHLVELHPTDRWGPAPPLLHLGVTVPEAIVARLRGEPPLLDPLGAIRRVPPTPPDAPLVIDPARRAEVDAAFHPSSAVLLSGPRSSGRRSLIQAICADRGAPLYIVEPRLPPDGWSTLLAAAARDARADGGGLLVRADDHLDGDTADALVDALRRATTATPVPLAITARRPHGALHRVLTVTDVELPLPTHRAQVDTWRRAFGDDARATRLADRFNMPIGAIIDALAHAHRAETDGAALDDACAAHLRARIDHALDAVADPVTTTLDWADVVLPDDVRESLEEIRAQARHRARVFDTWGFRRKMAYGRGLACLFSGPPGTGKTMMAGIIANDLGRALYRVDLSRVVSKWVGETEKNLARVFDEAEQAQVILFFDEADSLFSTRTEVKGANDRFANMEVNYLLQRMEQYDGISILTTNFERSIDEAFKRRLRFRVHFPLPDADQRSELWRRMVPPEMACDDDVRWDQLGKRYKFSGGAIKNAVLRAAFYAADAEGRLTDALLERAAEAERREMGKL